MRLDKETIISYNNFNALTNDIIELAKEIMPDKIIYINFLNEKVQVTMKVSQHDTNVNVFEGDTIPVEDAICNNIDYKNGTPLILENISEENDFNEKVKNTIEKGNVGAYLGIPITFKNGARFGALCAAHHNKGSFDQDDVELLQKIAKLFSYYLELEHIAYKDALTNLENTQFLIIHHDEILNNGGLSIMLDLDSFKRVNDELGHHIGDEVLKEVGKKLNSFSKNFDDVYTVRLGGDEFFIYIKDKLTNDNIHEALNELVNSLNVWETNINNINLSSSIGAYLFKSNSFNKFTDLLKTTDELLYKAKRSGGNSYVFVAEKR